MTSLEVHVLGRIGAVRDGAEVKLAPGLRQLLALLVAAGVKGASLDWLSDETWSEDLPSQWQASMRMAISRLRRATGLSIPSKNGHYRLDVDVTQVDAWKLLEAERQDGRWDPGLEALIAETVIFPSVEISPSLHAASVEIERAQRWSIERLSHEPLRQTRRLLSSLAQRVNEDPLDVKLCRAVALIHARSGAPGEAMTLIDLCRQTYLDTFGSGPPPGLDELYYDIQSQAIAAPSQRRDAGALSPAEPRLPFHLSRSRVERFAGRAGELDQLGRVVEPNGPTVVVVSGPPGSGKTSLLAEIGHRIASGGAYIVFIAGSPGGQVGLAPITASVGGFGAKVEAAGQQEHDAASRLGFLASSLLELLALEASGRRIVLLVDDAQWLDGPTCEIIDYLARSTAGNHPVALVLTVRSKPEGRAPWSNLQARLDRLSHAVHLVLGPLSETELGAIVAVKRPLDSFTARRQLTTWLHRVSGGRPAVACALLAIEDAPASGSNETEVFDRRIHSVGDEVRRACASAAVLGHRFRLPDLAALLGQSITSLLDVLEVAVRQDLIVETGALDEFEFSHQLIADAFARSISNARRARLHLKACDLTTNVHALSRHCVAAGELVERERAIAAVVASARAHLAALSFWESVAEFRVAIGLADGRLGASVYVDFARALSLSGARSASRGVREKAYGLAGAAGLWPLAHDAAVSGLPEAETPDGEDDRLSQLSQIQPEDLDPPRRLSQALWSARLAALLGHPDVARDWAQRATVLAATDEERVEAALVERLTGMVIHPPPVRLERLASSIGNLRISDRSRCRVSQIRAIDQLETGDLAAACRSLDEFELLASELADPLRRWHAMVFRSLIDEISGRWDEADSLARDALRLGEQFAVAQAEIVFRGHQYFRLLTMGRLGRLAGRIDDVPAPDADSWLFAASRARVLAAAGRQDEAAALAGEVARHVLDRPSVLSLGCLAFAAPALAHHYSNELKARVQVALAPFSGSFVVIGIGLGLFGPVDLLSASLSDPSRDHEREALEQAIKMVDSSGILSLQVRYRLDLAEITGSRERVAEARLLAAGSALVELLDEIDSGGSG
jgi:DNA-binding SARP family transcriptional activator